jgi:signal transduction histidine kinase
LEDKAPMSWVKRLFPSGESPESGGSDIPDAAPPPAPESTSVPESPPDAAVGREAVLRLEDVMRVQAVTASILTKKVNPRELFRHIVDGAADCLNADEASLMLIEGDTLRVVSARKAGEHVTVRIGRTKIGEGVAGWVAREGQALLLNEGDDFSRFTKFQPKGGRIQSSVSVPLFVEDRVVGVLNVNRLAGAERFTSEDLAVLRLFGDTAALSIDQTNLLETVQTRALSLQTLLSITDAFGGDREPEAALLQLLPGLGETFRPSLVLAFLGTTADDGGLPAIAEWTPRGGPKDAAVLAGITLSLVPEVIGTFTNREPDWISQPLLEGNVSRHTLLPPKLLLVPVGSLNAPSRCALLLGWDDPLVVLAAEDLNILEGLGRQLELTLSSQDRAATMGALQAEMAQARQHLVEAERLATVGQSMAGVVHDINAPLTAVTAFAQLIQKESVDEKSRERAGHIVEAASRAQRLVRELLKMARPTPPSLESVDLHQLLQVAMDLERPQCAVSGIKLIAAFEPELPQVKADPHRLGQVFINLLVNARQAMDSAEKGSSITVQTRRLDRVVEIRFMDDGPGIPTSIKQKIFDWFFTTKPPGEGTGLGLAVSREILLSQGGNLRVEDTPQGGATFVLELPLGDGAPASPRSA